MSRLYDKLILLALCLALYLARASGAYAVAPVLAAVTFGAAGSLLTREGQPGAVFAVYAATCVFWPPLLYFLPLLCYDVAFSPTWWAVFAVLLPLALHGGMFSPYTAAAGCVPLVLGLLMKKRALSMETLRKTAARRNDDARELSLALQQKNHELMEKQDYELNLATLNERNRIARDIHDNVGHLLSSAILQTGALLATCRDDTVRPGLSTLRGTLADAMDSIRSSVHNLYDESVDLHAEAFRLVNSFHFCPVRFVYEIDGNPQKQIKYAFLSVLKEALANIIRHSDATSVTVTMREHPALYQLIVRDNGTKKPAPHTEGIGLKNIAERVDNLGGLVRYAYENGFEVFVSVPKPKAGKPAETEETL